VPRTESPRTSVLLVDDHPVVREGVSSLLHRQPDLRVVGSVGDGRAAIHEAERLEPDVVVMDITMPGVNGIDATRAIAEKQPAIGVIMLSMHSSASIVRRAMDAGARGYLLKDNAVAELVDGVRTVALGSTYLGKGLATGAMPETSQGPNETALANTLTGPERKILKLVVEGNSNPEIAAMIGLTRRTVETYRLRLMRKLEVGDLPALVRYAIRHGIIALE
jgi:DNA-binding NarL/FixJ family response regulator